METVAGPMLESLVVARAHAGSARRYFSVLARAIRAAGSSRARLDWGVAA